jgi:hypothetical protein
MTEPVQRIGERQHQRKSRSKGQQIVDVMALVGAQYEAFSLALAHNPDEVDVAPVSEIIRLAGKLDELIRIPR